MQISIIVLNWNGGSATCVEAVASALHQTHCDKEVIFVDNGSTDGSVDAIRERFPGIHIIETGENLGVSRGRNIGAEAASGELLFFLENDGIWDNPQLVSDAIALFNRIPQLGAVYTRVVGYKTGLPDAPLDYHGPEAPMGGLWLASSFRGGACVIRRPLFRNLGGFPKEYFRQGEERYLSLLIYEAGYLIGYWPEHTMRHKGSDYPGKSAVVMRLSCENELQTVSRLYPCWPGLGVLLLKVAAWGARFVHARQVVTFAKILTRFPAWLRLRYHHGPVSIGTANLVEAITFSGFGCYQAGTISVAELKADAARVSVIASRVGWKLRKRV